MIIDFLQENPLFKGIDQKELKLFANRIGKRTIAKGEFLVYQGDIDKYIYIIVHGKLLAFKKDEKKEKVFLGELLRHDIIGELPMLADLNWHISLYALKETEVLVFSKDTLIALFQKYPLVISNVIDSMSEKFEQLTTKSFKKPSVNSIAIIQTEPSHNFDRFIHLYQTVLKKEGTVHLLTSEEINRQLASTEEKNIRQLITQLETTNDQIILTLNLADAKIIKTMMKLVDKILVVIDKDFSSLLFQSLKEIFAEHISLFSHFIELIFLHDKKIFSIQNWLSAFPNAIFHHIHLNRITDIERLVRISIEKSINLVLSGGGARAIAHIGILRALKEAHIPVDRIGGSGLGAIIAALFAINYSPDQIKRTLKHIFAHRGNFLDIHFPYISFIKAKKIRKILSALFQNKNIEELSIPFYCLSTSITTKQKYIHTKGLITKALLASLAIPGIMPPVYHEDHFLMTGSLSHNLPVDIMNTLFHSGIVVGVDVEHQNEPFLSEPFDDYLFGWKAIFKRIFTIRSQVQCPNILHTLLNVSYVTSAVQKKPCDILLQPNLKEIRSSDFDLIDVIVEKGYNETMKQIPELKDKIGMSS